LIGLAVGFSDFAQFAVYFVVFMSAGAFLKNVEEAKEAESIFIAIFAIMFGAFSAGQAKQYGPSTAKGLNAAQTIFSICDEEGEIDPLTPHQQESL